MRSTLRTIIPVEFQTREIVATGSVIVVKGGAWPTHRIHWEPPSSEPYKDANSQPLQNGRAYLSPTGEFKRFWLSFETIPVTPTERLVLEIFDCATPVVELGEHRAGMEVRTVYTNLNAAVNVDATTTGEVYADPPLVVPAGGSINDEQQRFVIPRGYVGGGIVATTAFTLQLYGKLGPETGDPVYWMATWPVTQVDVNGSFSCSLEHGGRVGHTNGMANTVSATTLLPWPLYGIQILLTAGAADCEYQAVIYERTPL